MASPERIYEGSVRALSFVFVGIGVAILVRTLTAGGGPLSFGTILGVLFIGIGCGRFWIASRTG